MKEVLFYIVIFLANTIQGVTGFAGTILAMPFSLQLVGYQMAVPVLNFIGILAGLYVFVFNFKQVQWKELIKIVVIMAIGIMVGVKLSDFMAAYDKVLYIILGAIVLILALKGLYETFVAKNAKSSSKKETLVLDYVILVLAGLVHGMFVCGGPLLITYLTKRVSEKTKFRATISSVWIFLNGLLLVNHLKAGMWTGEVIRGGIIAIPALFAGMAFGSFLYKRMDQRKFLILTYVLLLIAAVTLFMK